MSDKKISQLSNAGALTGTELAPIVQTGNTVKTTAQDIANLAIPVQSGNNGKYLKTNGTVTSWDNIDINTSDISGTLPIANGGTGQTSAQAAINSLAGSTTSGQYLRGNGSNVVMSSIQAGDVPTLNQNTTGTASNVTGIVAIANGGTGQTTAANAINALLPSQAGNSGKFLTTNGTDASWANAGSSGPKYFSALVGSLLPDAIINTIINTTGASVTASISGNDMVFTFSSAVLTSGKTFIIPGTYVMNGTSPSTKRVCDVTIKDLTTTGFTVNIWYQDALINWYTEDYHVLFPLKVEIYP